MSSYFCIRKNGVELNAWSRNNFIYDWVDVAYDEEWTELFKEDIENAISVGKRVHKQLCETLKNFKKENKYLRNLNSEKIKDYVDNVLDTELLKESIEGLEDVKDKVISAVCGCIVPEMNRYIQDTETYIVEVREDIERAKRAICTLEVILEFMEEGEYLEEENMWEYCMG